MEESDRSLHDQLQAARARLARELEILRTPSAMVFAAPDNTALIGALEAKFREIETALATLEADEG
ncbi:MAG TPA: hypothetical protein VGS12_05285 [Caulobacteraceae bacterium]|nr:hypothetical protein [Caulobacteraceae bacterium]